MIPGFFSFSFFLVFSDFKSPTKVESFFLDVFSILRHLLNTLVKPPSFFSLNCHRKSSWSRDIIIIETASKSLAAHTRIHTHTPTHTHTREHVFFSASGRIALSSHLRS